MYTVVLVSRTSKIVLAGTAVAVFGLLCERARTSGDDGQAASETARPAARERLITVGLTDAEADAVIAAGETGIAVIDALTDPALAERVERVKGRRFVRARFFASPDQLQLDVLSNAERSAYLGWLDEKNAAQLLEIALRPPERHIVTAVALGLRQAKSPEAFDPDAMPPTVAAALGATSGIPRESIRRVLLLGVRAVTAEKECTANPAQWPGLGHGRVPQGREWSSCTDAALRSLLDAPLPIQDMALASPKHARALAAWPALAWPIGQLVADNPSRTSNELAGRLHRLFAVAETWAEPGVPPIVTHVTAVAEAIWALAVSDQLLRLSLRCADRVQKTTEAVQTIAASTDALMLVNDCETLTKELGQPVAELLLANATLYLRMRATVPPTEAIAVMDVAHDALDHLTSITDEQLAGRLIAAGQSAWPRVELLVDLYGLGLDELSVAEASGYMDSLEALPTDRLLQEPDVDMKVRALQAISAGLAESAPELHFDPENPPEPVRVALLNIQSTKMGDLREAVLLGAFAALASRRCADSGTPAAKCAERARNFMVAREWIQTAALLDDRVAELLFRMPQLKHAAYWRADTGKGFLHHVQDLQRAEADVEVDRRTTATMLLLRAAERLFDMLTDDLKATGLELADAHPRLALELMASPGVWHTVVNLGKQHGCAAKIAMLVARAEDPMAQLGELSDPAMAASTLDEWTVVGSSLERSLGARLWHFVPGVKISKMLAAGDPTWQQLAWVGAWDLVMILPVGKAASAVAKAGGRALGATAKAVPAALRAARARFIRSVGGIRNLFGKRALAWAATTGRKAKDATHRAVGRFTFKMVPKVARFAEKLATSRALAVPIQLLKTRPGYTAACTGLSMGAAFGIRKALARPATETTQVQALARTISETAVIGGVCFATSKGSAIRKTAAVASRVRAIPGIKTIVRVAKEVPGAARTVTVYKLGPVQSKVLFDTLKTGSKHLRAPVERFAGKHVSAAAGRAAVAVAKKGVAKKVAIHTGTVVLTVAIDPLADAIRR